MAQATGHKSNISKTIDLSENTIKLLKCRALLKPKTTPQTINDGDRWPALCHGETLPIIHL